MFETTLSSSQPYIPFNPYIYCVYTHIYTVYIFYTFPTRFSFDIFFGSTIIARFKSCHTDSDSEEEKKYLYSSTRGRP